MDIREVKHKSDLENFSKTSAALKYFYDFDIQIDLIVERYKSSFIDILSNENLKMGENELLEEFMKRSFHHLMDELVELMTLKNVKLEVIAEHSAYLALLTVKYCCSDGNRNLFEYMAKWKKSLV